MVRPFALAPAARCAGACTTAETLTVDYDLARLPECRAGYAGQAAFSSLANALFAPMNVHLERSGSAAPPSSTSPPAPPPTPPGSAASEAPRGARWRHVAPSGATAPTSRPPPADGRTVSAGSIW